MFLVGTYQFISQLKEIFISNYKTASYTFKENKGNKKPFQNGRVFIKMERSEIGKTSNLSSVKRRIYKRDSSFLGMTNHEGNR